MDPAIDRGTARSRAPLEPADALVVDGRVLRSGRGLPVTLQGTNVGGWFMQEGWLSPAGRPSLDRQGWRVSASSDQPHDAPRDPVDDRDVTTWRPASATPGPQWLTLDMGHSRVIDAVSFEVVSGSLSDLRLLVSSDGTAWRPVGHPAPGAMRQVVGFEFTPARFVRIEMESTSGLGIGALRTHVTDEYHLRAALERRFGEGVATSLLDGYQDAWFGADDLDHVAGLGLNLVRVPIHWQVLMRDDGTVRPAEVAFRKLDWVVHEAARRGLYTILDLHGAPGGANPWHSSGQAGANRLWSDPRMQSWTERLWRLIAERYLDAPGVAGYDLVNEPVVGDGTVETPEQMADKHRLLDRLYRAVRSVDADRVVFVPAFPDPERAWAPSALGWANVVYETHHFAFDALHDRAAAAEFVARSVRQLVERQREWDIPMFAGEFWFGPFTDLFATFTHALDAEGISWATWTYKTKNALDGRDADGVDHGRNWGLFGAAPDAVPDLDHDDASAIAQKWRRYVTSNLQPNDELAAAIRRPIVMRQPEVLDVPR